MINTKLLAFIFFLVPGISAAKAQTIKGNWRSSDNSRKYIINEKNGQYTATLKSSSRSVDNPNAVILDHITYNKKKKRYEGLIYSAEDHRNQYVQIEYEGDKMRLRMKRLLVLNVDTYWYKN